MSKGSCPIATSVRSQPHPYRELPWAESWDSWNSKDPSGTLQDSTQSLVGYTLTEPSDLCMGWGSTWNTLPAPLPALLYPSFRLHIAVTFSREPSLSLQVRLTHVLLPPYHPRFEWLGRLSSIGLRAQEGQRLGSAHVVPPVSSVEAGLG